MKILYVGDIMAGPGRNVAKYFIPQIKKAHKIDVVIAQAENVSHGRSMSIHHMRELQAAGIDFFTGGNHTVERKDIQDLLANPAEPVLAPANFVDYPREWGVKELVTPKGIILLCSLLGQTVPFTPDIHNPLHVIDDVLKTYPRENYAAVVVNFHGDYSSEKRVIGYYTDGRVTALIGDHWHVPTADAMVLPHGTAHITDVGMCGTLHSSLGVELDVITKRWYGEGKGANKIAEAGPFQFNAVIIEVDVASGLAKKITPINKTIEEIE